MFKSFFLPYVFLSKLCIWLKLFLKVKFELYFAQQIRETKLSNLKQVFVMDSW